MAKKQFDMSDTFCVLPFLHMKVGVDGRLSPCCRFPTVNDDYNFYDHNIGTRSLEEMFQSPEYTRLRERMLAGEKIKGCDQCYKDEAAGASSLRTYKNSQYAEFAARVAETPKIHFLEVAVGNVCNLKCVMCNAGYSYKWAHDEAGLLQNDFTRHRPSPESIRKVDNDLNFSPESLRELRDLKVVGGEPLFQSKMVDFLYRLGELGIAQNVALEIYTNVTHWPSEKALKALGMFREVQLLFSIDGVGPQVEYIRYPTKWKDIQKNVGQWLEVPKTYPGVYITCNFTVNALNALYYADIADWWHETTRHTPFEKHLETTFVNDPDYLSLSVLPEAVKAVIREKTEDYKNRYPERIYVRQNTKRLLTRLNLKPETTLDHFFKYLNTMDRLRTTDYRATFPELYKLLAPYESPMHPEPALHV